MVTFALAFDRGAERSEDLAQLRVLAPNLAGSFISAAAAAPLAIRFGFHSIAVACRVLLAMFVLSATKGTLEESKGLLGT